MDIYLRLTQELFSSMDQKKGPQLHEEISAAMRGEMAVMRLLMQEDRPFSSGELSRELEMTTSRIAAVLNSLEKKQFIMRSADSADRRRVIVTLTNQGREICRIRRQQAVTHMCAFLKRLGEEDAKTFVRLMKRVHEEFMTPQTTESQSEQA